MKSTAFRCSTERCVRRQDGRLRLASSVQCAWSSLRSLFLMPWTICGINMNTRRRDSTLTSGWAKADKIIFTWSVSSLSGASGTGSEEDSRDWADIGVTFSLPVARGVEHTTGDAIWRVCISTHDDKLGCDTDADSGLNSESKDSKEHEFNKKNVSQWVWMLGRGGLNNLLVLRCFIFFTIFLDPSFNSTGVLDKRLEFRAQLCFKWSTNAWLETNWLTHNRQIPMLLSSIFSRTLLLHNSSTFSPKACFLHAAPEVCITLFVPSFKQIQHWSLYWRQKQRHLCRRSTHVNIGCVRYEEIVPSRFERLWYYLCWCKLYWQL